MAIGETQSVFSCIFVSVIVFIYTYITKYLYLSIVVGKLLTIHTVVYSHVGIDKSVHNFFRDRRSQTTATVRRKIEAKCGTYII